MINNVARHGHCGACGEPVTPGDGVYYYGTLVHWGCDAPSSDRAADLACWLVGPCACEEDDES